MTNIITPPLQNVDLSSWITLYTAVFVCTQEQKVRESSDAISVAL